jgi:hypothetical protein
MIKIAITPCIILGLAIFRDYFIRYQATNLQLNLFEYFTVMIPTIFNWIPVAHTLIPWTIHKSILAIHGMILLPYNVYQGINIQYSLIHYKGGHKYVQKNCREAHYGIAC